MPAYYHNQTLGCGAHVRIIALPHMRCAYGKGLKLCVRFGTNLFQSHLLFFHCCTSQVKICPNAPTTHAQFQTLFARTHIARAEVR